MLTVMATRDIAGRYPDVPSVSPPAQLQQEVYRPNASAAGHGDVDRHERNNDGTIGGRASRRSVAAPREASIHAACEIIDRDDSSTRISG